MAYRSGISRERSRRRRRLLGRAVLVLAGVAVFVGIGYSAFLSGSKLAMLQVADLKAEIARQAQQLQDGAAETGRLQASLTQAQDATGQLRRRYETDVPSGPLAGLVQLLKDKMAAGQPPERIAKVLGELAAAPPCVERVTRKRAEIQTGAQNPDSTVTFMDGLLQVSVAMRGDSADPAKATTVTIGRAWAAQPITATGLPLRQTITVNGVDTTLTVEPADLRGYAAVTFSTCAK
jgi:hypothetical protein